jgi:hypothetical protein
MRSTGKAALVVMALAVSINAAGAADLPVKPKPAAERISDQRLQPSSPERTEQLFQQFLDWLRQR